MVFIPSLFFSYNFSFFNKISLQAEDNCSNKKKIEFATISKFYLF